MMLTIKRKKFIIRNWNYFGVKKIFFGNFDVKNGCQTEFKDDKGKSCSWSRNRLSLKIDLKALWPCSGRVKVGLTSQPSFQWSRSYFSAFSFWIGPSKSKTASYKSNNDPSHIIFFDDIKESQYLYINLS